MRPTLYLTNLGSKKWHGPGRKVCAMARPGQHNRGDGRCAEACPDADALRAVQRSLERMDVGGNHHAALAHYRSECESRFAYFDRLCRYQPGTTPGDLSMVTEPSFEPDGRRMNRNLADGDTLFCACARPGSPKRVHPCHIELLPPFLVRAGWDVRLDGRLVTMGEDGPVWAEDMIHPFPGEVDTFAILAARKGASYRAKDFGWPEAT